MNQRLVRLRKGEVAAWIGIMANIALALFKLAAGVLANSQAMLADAVHSGSDIVASGAVLVGLRIAQRPPDAEHPYGHARAETVAAKLVGLILLLVGLQIFSSAGRSILVGVAEAPGVLAVWAALTSIVVKEILFHYKIRVGRAIASQAVKANAWEHRSDALSSVATLIGVVGARSGWLWLDPLAALVVAVLVLRMGWILSSEAIYRLMDGAPAPATMASIATVVEGVAGVECLHEVKIRHMGPNLMVDVKIGVCDHISVYTGHCIAKQVKDCLQREIQGVQDVMVHVNPVSTDSTRQ
jgi:cation diffusion facilitator family transporter